MPKVSIIVPNYNHARYLPKRLDSIFNQTYQDFEVILLDDCSTDNSAEVLRKYANHTKVSHFIINKENSGSPFMQWKKGINLAQGEYIWIAESDDYADLFFLENLIDILDSELEIGIAYSQSLRVDEHNNIIDSYKDFLKIHNDNKWNNSYKNLGSDEVKECLIWRNTIPNASAVLIRKKILLEVGFIPEDMRMVGDWHLYISMLKYSNIGFSSKPLNYHRLHPQATRIHNTKKKKNTRFKEETLVIKYVLDNFIIEDALKEEVLDTFFGRLTSWLSLRDIIHPQNWSLLYASSRNDGNFVCRLLKLIVSRSKNRARDLVNKVIRFV